MTKKVKKARTAQEWGRIGGLARKSRLTQSERSAIARMGGLAARGKSGRKKSK